MRLPQTGIAVAAMTLSALAACGGSGGGSDGDTSGGDEITTSPFTRFSNVPRNGVAELKGTTRTAS